MAQQLTDILTYFLDNYIQGKKEKNGKDAAAWKAIRDSAPEKVYETGLVDAKKYLVKGSVGKGVWADVPWLGVFRKDITTSAQNGVYIVYLLSSDSSAIYLTFNQGVTNPIKNVNPYLKDVKDDDLKKSKGKIIQENVAIVRNKIDKRIFQSDDEIHLAEKGLGEQYEKGTIFYKKYVKGGLPSEEQLQKDLKEMLEIYEEFYEQFYKSIPVKQQEEETKMANENMNMIFFGAPGTGKSYKIDSNLFKDENGNSLGKGIKAIPDARKFRTTFHPDYDYAQFVGAYKPKKVENIDNGLLTKEQLAQKLFEVFPNNSDGELDKTTAITLFGLQYANSLKDKNMKEIVRLSNIGADQYKSAYLSAATKARLEFSDIDEKITYSFVPQVFAKAYATAWKQYIAAGNASTTENQVYLVIEEINRGNCAQIFGDIFQLLDRDGKGFSQYSIDADCDFATWLKEDSVLKIVWNDYEAKVGDGKLKLPPNLNILATMNTSDQSLFPMDSAFKRRFDWEYVPIKYAKDDDCGDDWKADEFKIIIGNSTYMWLDFLKKVNVDIDETTHSEDKQMGEFFIKPKSDDLKIAFNEFRSKVLFYLWDSVYKDETERQAVFHFPYGDGDGKINSVTFQSLFGKDAEAIVNKIMENLKVEKVTT